MTKNENKSEALRVRVTSSEKRMLEEMCRKYRVTMSELIRAIIFNTEVLDYRKSDVDYLQLLKQVQIEQQLMNDILKVNRGVANNINQIVKSAHISNNFNDKNKAELAELINRFYKHDMHFKKEMAKRWQSQK